MDRNEFQPINLAVEQTGRYILLSKDSAQMCVLERMIVVKTLLLSINCQAIEGISVVEELDVCETRPRHTNPWLFVNSGSGVVSQ